MRFLLPLSLLTVCLAVGRAQTVSPAGVDVADLSADQLTREGGLLHAVGHVKAGLGGLTFQAGEAASDPATGELALRGRVQVTLPARGDQSVFRYGSGNLITPRPVLVQADRLDVKNGLLHAWGHVLVQPVDPEATEPARLEGEELVLSLRTADATVRGSVRTNNAPAPRNFRTLLPPDIVK